MRWEDYLETYDEKSEIFNSFPLATDADIDNLEQRLGVELPQDFREALKKWQGKTTDDLEVVLPSGSKPAFTCLYHAVKDHDKYDGYEIGWITGILREDGYGNVVVFSDSGNASYCFDYDHDPDNPPVIFINKDLVPEDKKCKVLIASSFTDFLNKFGVDH